MITNLYSEKVYTLMIDDNDMEDDVPNFTTYNGNDLENGTIAFNMTQSRAWAWDEEEQEWSELGV